ncbi:MAG: DNA repair protein RadA [Steroidobacteraceae bacterium]
MARPSTLFSCTECASTSLKWQGQCPACGAWNTLVEATAGRKGVAASSASAALPGVAGSTRWPTGQAELDRVLGGGLVPGSVLLLGGDPGIGKSTLLTQLGAALARNVPVLYASAEESLPQIRLRASRLGLEEAPLRLLCESDLDEIMAQARACQAGLLVVDSVQTIASSRLTGVPGAVAQLRECAQELVRFAKSTDTAVILVGHVTKEGTLAGPRVLEHLVDTVLYFESDSGSRYRIIRAVKNRFGPASELAFYAMTEQGLRGVRNSSALFLTRPERPAPGSVVAVTHDSGRPLLVELQALVDQVKYGQPRRMAQGLDAQRLAMLLAVLHRHAAIALADADVFVNLVGGLEVREPATDLAIVAALVSSHANRAVPAGLALFGEIGLTGEVRPVAYGEERLIEASRQGFTVALAPRANLPRKPIKGLDVRAVERVDVAVGELRSLCAP